MESPIYVEWRRVGVRGRGWTCGVGGGLFWRWKKAWRKGGGGKRGQVGGCRRRGCEDLGPLSIVFGGQGVAKVVRLRSGSHVGSLPALGEHPRGGTILVFTLVRRGVLSV